MHTNSDALGILSHTEFNLGTNLIQTHATYHISKNKKHQILTHIQMPTHIFMYGSIFMYGAVLCGLEKEVKCRKFVVSLKFFGS